MKNIIFLISDQMQRRSVLEDPRRIMPNVEKLRADSIDFVNMHTVNAICSPARASMLTGMLPHNHGMVDCTHTVPKYRADFNAELQTLPQILKDNGYSICYYGKWHVERSYKLEDFGIDEYETEHDIPKASLTPVKRITVSTPGYRTSTVAGIYEEDETASEEHYVYSKAMDFIKRHADDDHPFCAFISTYAPHDPYVVPLSVYKMYDGISFDVPDNWDTGTEGKPSIYKRLHEVWSGLTDDEIKDVIRCYYSSCTLVDLQVRRLMDFLKESGLYDDTLIVFTSDHGDMAGSHGLFCKGVPAFEDVYSIPLLVKPSGTGLKPGECDVYADTCDILPTVVELAGIRWQGKADGKSLVPYMEGKSSAGTYSLAEFFGQRYSYTQRIVWSDGYKYVFNAFDNDELYDLGKDPGENVNLAADPKYSGIKEKLCALMWKRIEETDDWSMRDAQYFLHRFAPVGPNDGDHLSSRFSMFNKAF